MLNSGYEGVREIQKRLTNTVGWSATSGQVRPVHLLLPLLYSCSQACCIPVLLSVSGLVRYLHAHVVSRWTMCMLLSIYSCNARLMRCSWFSYLPGTMLTEEEVPVCVHAARSACDLQALTQGSAKFDIAASPGLPMPWSCLH